MLAEQVNYCPRCGAKLDIVYSFGADRPVCGQCGWIYFADPKVAVAALIERDQKVLLVRRVNDPARGLWTLPAGFVDAGEDPALAVIRECREETGLEVCIRGLHSVLAGQEHPRGAHILIVYCAEVIAGTLRAADDVDKVNYFARNDLPPLAFQTTRRIIFDPDYSLQDCNS